jgi:adenylate cyclase, class 2
MAFDGVEIEIKLRLTSAEGSAFRKVLLNHPHSVVQQRDVYFDTPNRTFSSKEPIEEWLSCRERGEQVHLNHKKFTYGDDGLAMDCREVDIVVSSSAAASELLNALGFYELVTVTKKRMETLIDDVLVALDEVVGLGLFVELEATKSRGDYHATRNYLFLFAQKLGIQSRDADNRGYPYQMIRSLP